MSGPTFEEMEAKRQEMIASFKDIAAAMTRCVSIIEDYTRLSPSSLPTLNSFSGLPTLSAAELAKAVSTIDATSIPVEKKKRNRDKKPKDPNAPKRPPSAYILYQNEVRDALRSERPELAYKDILALISEKWKQLPDAERKVFEAKYVDAQNQFKTLDDAYKSGAAVTKPVAAVVSAAADESSDSSDDSDDSDDDSLPAPTPFQQQPYLATPQHGGAAGVAPSLLNSAQATVAATPDVKKEKKRKNKDAADATATPAAEEDKKKKKKKSKD